MLNPELHDIFRYWIEERLSILELKNSGAAKPWTPDLILQQFKFCNVKREDDRVTKWFRRNWRSDIYEKERNFVPCIMLGRIINWPDTLEELGYQYIWDMGAVHATLEERAKRGDKVYTGAYMVSQYGSKLPKNRLVVTNADRYFNSPPKIEGMKLAEAYKELVQYEGVGPFMAGQIIADLKYTHVLRNAGDWHSWAVVGPGSTRGLNRLHDRPVNYQMSEDQGLEEITELRKDLNNRFHAQDVQNCLCEFDKYMRVKLGQGLPRSRYDGFGP